MTRWTPEKVAAAPDPTLAFAEYAQQIVGTPWPTLSDQQILRSRIRQIFDHYPHADYHTLCRLAQWCRARKKRDPRVWMLVDRFREAWVAGALPELDPTSIDATVETRIAQALDVEQRPAWRQRLLGALGAQNRLATIEAWEAQR